MRKRRRFTPEFKAKVVLEVLTGTQSPADACLRHALSPNLLGARPRNRTGRSFIPLSLVSLDLQIGAHW